MAIDSCRKQIVWPGPIEEPLPDKQAESFGADQVCCSRPLQNRVGVGKAYIDGVVVAHIEQEPDNWVNKGSGIWLKEANDRRNQVS